MKALNNFFRYSIGVFLICIVILIIFLLISKIGTLQQGNINESSNNLVHKVNRISDVIILMYVLNNLVIGVTIIFSKLKQINIVIQLSFFSALFTYLLSLLWIVNSIYYGLERNFGDLVLLFVMIFSAFMFSGNRLRALLVLGEGRLTKH